MASGKREIRCENLIVLILLLVIFVKLIGSVFLLVEI